MKQQNIDRESMVTRMDILYENINILNIYSITIHEDRKVMNGKCYQNILKIFKMASKIHP